MINKKELLQPSAYSSAIKTLNLNKKDSNSILDAEDFDFHDTGCKHAENIRIKMEDILCLH